MQPKPFCIVTTSNYEYRWNKKPSTLPPASMAIYVRPCSAPLQPKSPESQKIIRKINNLPDEASLQHIIPEETQIPRCNPNNRLENPPRQTNMCSPTKIPSTHSKTTQRTTPSAPATLHRPSNPSSITRHHRTTRQPPSAQVHPKAHRKTPPSHLLAEKSHTHQTRHTTSPHPNPVVDKKNPTPSTRSTRSYSPREPPAGM